MGRYKVPFSFCKVKFVLMLLVSSNSLLAQPAANSHLTFNEILTTPVDSGRVTGVAVTVMKKGELIYNTTYGFADVANKIPLTLEHQFQIGSITKIFTATAILKLCEMGKISLNDRLSYYLNDFDTRGHDPTIQQLLHHTSGLPEYTRHLDNSSHGTMKERVLSSIENVPPYFKPGINMAYSNSGYYLLGLIIEKVTSMSYDNFVEKELLKPYGFNNISYYQPNDRVNRVKGYQLKANNNFSMSEEFDPAYPFSAGSISTNASDLVIWFHYLNSGKILNNSSYNKMLEVAKLPCGHPSWYGLGLIIETDPSGRKVIRHGGSHPSGFTSDLRYYPAENLYISVLINTISSPDRPEKICVDIANFITGQQQKTLKAIYPGNLDKHTGSYYGYRSSQQTIIDVFFENGKLMKAEPGTLPLQLFYVEGNTFTTGPSDFGDSPEYTFVNKDTIRELHYTDNGVHTIFSDYQDPMVIYWQTGTTKTSYVEVDGKKVRIRTKTPFPNRFPGQPIVVLEAGFGASINSWGRFFEQIGNFIPVIAYDRPGLGESEWVEHTPTDLYYAERLKKVLNVIDAEPPYVVVGHSYGCDLVRVFADKYPLETSGIVLVDPVSEHPNEVLQAFESIGKGKQEYDDLVDLIFQDDQTPLGIASRNYEMPLWQQLVKKNLPEPLNKPIKILFAGQKPTKSLIDNMPFDIVAHQKELNRLMLKRISEWIYKAPEGEMIIIPGSGHYVHRDEPDISLKAVKDVVYPDISRALQHLVKEEGIDKAITSYYKRKAYYPVEYFNEDLLNQIGYKLIRSEEFGHAIAIFQLNIKEYPNEPNPHDSLGDAYRLVGDLEQAVKCYSRAAEIAEKMADPRAENYRRRFEHYQSVLMQK